MSYFFFNLLQISETIRLILQFSVKFKWEILDAGGRPSTASIQFSAVSTLQQSFNRSCCFCHKRLFIEFFCKLLCAALKKAQLIYNSSGGTIATLLSTVWSSWTEF